MIRLLLVEDDANLRYIIQGGLEDMIGGYEIKDAANGVEGLKIWQEWKPDVIVSDIEMPVMDGYQVSPMQIVTAYMAKEEGAYMRDYVMEKIKSPCITLEIGVAGCPLPISQFSSIWRKNESLVLREAKLLL